MTYCISKKTRQNKLDFLLTNTKKTFICVSVRVCVCARVCLDLVLLLVRWVSVKRITAVSLLYPHTLSQRPTFTRPTFHSTLQPPSSAPFYRKTLNLIWNARDKENNQNNKIINRHPVVEAGLNWGIFLCALLCCFKHFVTELPLNATLKYKSE